jgi:leucyl aminopeptidase
MEVKVVQGALYDCDADAIIIGLFEGSQPEGESQQIDRALDGAVSDLVNAGDIKGKLGETAVLYSRGAIPSRRVIVAGMGPKADFDLEALRRVAAHAICRARDLRLGRVASALPGGITGNGVALTAQAVTEGSLLALYDYRGQKTDEATEVLPRTFELYLQPEQDLLAVQRGIGDAQAIAAGVIVARDLVNLPPNICTPAYMADIAKQVASETGLRAQSLDEGEMADLGMGALLAVARGSDTPPHLIVMEHNADRASELDTIVLVGKGVTFDTGGYSLKPRESMATMKGDMAGAAAVIGAMRAIAALRVPLHVVGLAPAADNMISGHAYRPQEVVIASNGVTIEIISTDAEGRMLLADALVYAGRYQPVAVVDIATLTGTCAAALGGVAAGVFGTDDALLNRLQSASAVTAEKLWPLPLFSEYEEAIKSETADVKNSGGKSGGIGSSAIFLRHFISYPAWAHIDMAGLAFDAKNNPYVPGKGATGFGVRLLTEFVRSWSR